MCDPCETVPSKHELGSHDKFRSSAVCSVQSRSVAVFEILLRVMTVLNVECATDDAEQASSIEIWLQWMLRVLQTTPALLQERHTNPWFVIFLSICFPCLNLGVMVRAPRFFCFHGRAGMLPRFSGVSMQTCLN